MDTPAMTVVELTDDEVRLLNHALHSYLSVFGHDESDMIHAVRHLLDKIAASQAAAASASE